MQDRFKTKQFLHSFYFPGLRLRLKLGIFSFWSLEIIFKKQPTFEMLNFFLFLKVFGPLLQVSDGIFVNIDHFICYFWIPYFRGDRQIVKLLHIMDFTGRGLSQMTGDPTIPEVLLFDSIRFHPRQVKCCTHNYTYVELSLLPAIK